MAQIRRGQMVGKQIGNFQIIDKLGEGGMGVVYKGIDIQLERPVAIKMLSPELTRNPELVQRFQAEARAQANLNHTNIATLYAFLVTEEGACMVMEFVEGESFEQILRRAGPMNPREAVPLFKQALLGIGAAHRMGIIHRDIKPANLMLNRQGIVKVMDFGIAKALGARGMTRTGVQVGTVLYMSPEQIHGRGIDVRSDIYSLGVTLYEMLTGHVPFESESDFQVMADHVNTVPPPLTRVHPYAEKQFEGVVAKALEKNPDNRFQTVEEFGSALEHPEKVPMPTNSAFPASGPARGGTIVEAPSGNAGAAVGKAPIAVSSRSGTVPVATNQPAGLPPAPISPPSARNKVIAGVVIAAALALAVIALRPKPQPPADPGVSGGVQSQNAQGGQSGGGHNSSPSKSIVMVQGDTVESTPDSTTSPTAKATPPRPVAAPARQPQTSVRGDSVNGQDQQTYRQQQPAPQRQPQPAQQARSFPVKHRHIVTRGFQSFAYFCGGWLTVMPDGSVSYVCSATNDPTGRCERVTFPSGTVRDAQLKSGGELHISTSGMGNWDFFDLNVAGSTASAFQAIQARR